MNFLDWTKTINIESDKYPESIETNRLLIKKEDPDVIAIFYSIYLKNTKKKIGSITFLHDGEIWYKIEKSYQRRGYMTEAISKTLDCIDIENLYLSIRKDNNPSISFADKIGFKKVKSVDNKYIYKKNA